MGVLRNTWIASILTFLFWQTPHLFNFAKSCKHLFILFINSCPFRDFKRLDEVSMGAVKYNKRIHATEFPATYVIIGNIGGIVHDMWVVNGDTHGRFLLDYSTFLILETACMRYRLVPALYSILF